MNRRFAATIVMLAALTLTPGMLRAEGEATAPAAEAETAPVKTETAPVMPVAAPTDAKADGPASAAANKEVVHTELRALRDTLIAALNKHDIEGILKSLHPNVVYTAPDARVNRGREGVRKYFDMMMTGPNKIVKDFSSKPTVDELTILYADDRVGVVFGSSDDTLKLTRGIDFRQTTRWTATVVKEDGQWLIASFHASADMFDNPLLDIVKKGVRWAAIGGFVAGVIVMAVIGWLRGSRQSGGPAAAA